MKYEVHHGDCLEVLRTLPDNSFDSIVTDPPYGLSFMGKKWDYDVPAVEVWAECLRVLKPGGHLLAFAGTRTQHRMAVRIEDAGFEIRDMIAWVYGSGFPKSHNGEWGGTALKPALEPITVARKPLVGTVEQNWREYGTGALNIDACRVGDEIRHNAPAGNKAGGSALNMSAVGMPADAKGRDATGRWPANLIHDGSDEVLAAFPQAAGQQGDLKQQDHAVPQGSASGQCGPKRAHVARIENDKSAARFFYCAKASANDRDAGVAGVAGGMSGRRDGSMGSVTMRKNTHPTVKPTDLMRHLCRLVTPPVGVVLDPFTGSGSTGKAAMLEGFRFVGVEREAEYVAIARARIEAPLRQAEEAPRDMFEQP